MSWSPSRFSGKPYGEEAYQRFELAEWSWWSSTVIGGRRGAIVSVADCGGAFQIGGWRRRRQRNINVPTSTTWRRSELFCKEQVWLFIKFFAWGVCVFCSRKAIGQVRLVFRGGFAFKEMRIKLFLDGQRVKSWQNILENLDVSFWSWKQVGILLILVR